MYKQNVLYNKIYDDKNEALKFFYEHENNLKDQPLVHLRSSKLFSCYFR